MLRRTHASKKRRRVEGRERAFEQDEVEHVSYDEDSEEEGSHATKSKQKPNGFGIVDVNEDIESDDELASDTVQSTSSFHEHLGYKLSEDEVANLPNKKWKYKWDVPAYGIAKCKWLGTGDCFLKNVDMNSGYGLKQRLYKHWLDVYKASGGNDFHSSMQRFFFSLCNSYRDILHCNKKPFYLKGLEVDSSIMDSYIIHCLNHIFRTRDLVRKNDLKETKHLETGGNEFCFLDHGFTRPKVLVLLPFRSIAFRVVKRLIQLTPQAYKANVEHLNRFSNEFGSQENENNVEDNQLAEDDGSPKPKKSSKPSDHKALFSGNCDDRFMIGIKFTRRSIRLFNDFYSSDLIVASPLKLRENIDAAAEDKEKDVDYLSSIEVLIIDHADIIAMQNWSFVTSILEQLNRLPSKQHGTNITRIRDWYLEARARFYRQTIITSYYATPDINGSFNHLCVNYHGKVKSVCEHTGVHSKVLDGIRQIYERFDASSVSDADDARLNYFVQKVFPKIKDSDQGGIMLFINSYFEYVRLRNFFKSQNTSFCLLGDYAEQSDISRARVWFFEGKRKIMLYTQRLHFYRRYKIRGVRSLIIYSLPDRKDFYPEVVNMLEGTHDMTCTVLFSRFDQLQLERIVGTGPARRMVTSDKGLFVFC